MSEILVKRLSEDAIAEFDRTPEAGMGLHWASDQKTGARCAVIGGMVVIDLAVWETGSSREGLPETLPSWIFSDGGREGTLSRFSNWFHSLEIAKVVPVSPPPPGGAGIDTPGGRVKAPPSSGGSVYGHLMFLSHSEAESVFYRWEAFPTSRRIDQAHGTVLPGTFAAPMSELAFMPTGFSAVARCALPNPFPACFRWELQPRSGADFYCGASVPLFGQSGGGVEVMFLAPPNGSDIAMRGPIANPVVLPAL